MNLAYKHLESKLKIGELTLLQWFGVFLGVMVAIGWGLYLSPLGTTLTMVTSIYFGGIPLAAVFLASFSEFDLWMILRSAAAWRRSDDRYLPGPGASAHGYVIEADAVDVRHQARVQARDLDLATLWES